MLPVVNHRWSDLEPVEHIVLLYDRMANDLSTAEDAVARSDRKMAQRSLHSFRAVLTMLSGALDYGAAPSMAGLLDQVYHDLEVHVAGGSLDQLAAGRHLLQPVHEAWIEVARVSLGREPARLHDYFILSAEEESSPRRGEFPTLN